MNKYIEKIEIYEINKYNPKEFKKGIIYFSKKNKQIKFICPNVDCNHLVTLDTKYNGHTDTWKVLIKGNKMFKKVIEGTKVSLDPSIWSKNHKHNCHYFIKSGKVISADEN